MKKTANKSPGVDALANLKCVSCQDGGSSLRGAALRALSRALGHQWKIVKGHHLEKEFKFKDFKTALAFTNRVGALAEKQGHHPDIYLAWGKVKVTIWTHSAGGLTESDFVLAARIEKLPS
jgi:4a-hydroxytetrahydrobiopterin dehydratase